MNIAVLGGGSWGTALAHMLAGKGHEVHLLMRDASVAEAVNSRHENPRYLKGLPLHPGVRAQTDPAKALPGAEFILNAIPCQQIRGAFQDMAPLFAPGCVIVNASKGIEISGGLPVSRIIDQVLGHRSPRYAVLSGPSFAEELLKNMPTAVVLACADATLGAHLREAFSTPVFRTYSSTDVIGVELGGAVKNIIAIAAGLSDGLGLGGNARAALITRGLAEISRLGAAMGARASTFMGLSGMGDLVLTTTGDLSRNRHVGRELASGKTLEQISASMNMVAEGVHTTYAVHALAGQLGVDMPITTAVHALLHNHLPPEKAVRDLMTRALKEE